MGVYGAFSSGLDRMGPICLNATRKGTILIVQFLLRLVFFYCLFIVIKVVLKNFAKTPASAAHRPASSKANGPDVFEAEYTVVKEDQKS